MKPITRVILALTLGVAAIAVFILWQGGLNDTAANAPAVASTPTPTNAVIVEAAAVETRNLDKLLSAVGTLRAKESVTLASEIAGRVDKIFFEEGHRVEAGAVLFQLDTSILNASVQSANAAHELARSTFERTESLSKRGISATQTLDEAQANLHSTEAALALAQAQLDQASIKAPFNGVIGLRSVSVGAYVTAGSSNLAKLDQIDPLVAEFTLPEVALVDVSVGQTVSITTDALPGQPFSGSIYAIEPSIDEVGRSIRLRALIENPELKLRPGLFARVEVTAGTKADTMLVPESAIVPTGASQNVYRINADSTVDIVPVSLGQRLDGKVEILNGLDSDDRVVTAGQQKLRAGSKVQEQTVEGSL